MLLLYNLYFPTNYAPIPAYYRPFPGDDLCLLTCYRPVPAGYRLFPTYILTTPGAGKCTIVKQYTVVATLGHKNRGTSFSESSKRILKVRLRILKLGNADCYKDFIFTILMFLKVRGKCNYNTFSSTNTNST